MNCISLNAVKLFQIFIQCEFISLFFAIYSLFYVQVFACTVIYCATRFNDCCSGCTYYITCCISFPTGVVDCINYSFNCCDAIFTIYAWFAVCTLFDVTKVNVVFNLTICINGSSCVVTIDEVQAFRQFNCLFSTAISSVIQFCIAKVSCFRTYLVDCLTICTSTGCYFYVIPFFNLCLSRFQLFYVNRISIVYASFHISDIVTTNIDIPAIEFEFVTANCESSRATVLNCVDVIQIFSQTDVDFAVTISTLRNASFDVRGIIFGISFSASTFYSDFGTKFIFLFSTGVSVET